MGKQTLKISKDKKPAQRAGLTKDEIYWKVLKSAMALDFKRGHCGWTIAELARSSGVSRPLIYYYFGKKRLDILLASVRLIGEECFGLSDERIELWKKGKIRDSVKQSRKFVEEHPEMAAFYFAQRAKSNPVGEAFRQIEKKYLEKLRRFFADRSECDRSLHFALLFGAVFAPLISDEAIEKIKV